MGAVKVRCICQICTCGRHHCIHKPQLCAQPKGPCAITEYKDTYRKFSNYRLAKPIKPDPATTLSDKPFNGLSSYTKEYVPHSIEPHKRREPVGYTKPSGDFDGRSSYQHDFYEKYQGKRKSAKPEYQRTLYNEPFNGQTVHNETYKEWELPMNVGIRPPEAIKLNTSKFNHKSTFQHDFPGHAAQRRDSCKIPEPSLSLPTGSFANETTTRIDYPRKTASPVKSAKPPQHVLKHKDPFDHSTTCQNAYRWPYGRPASSCKPEKMTRPSLEPFDQSTTHNTTYKPWSVPKRTGWKPKSGWTAPLDPFDHKTTFQHDYIKKHFGPAKSARPDYIRVQPGDFDGLTTHNNAFKPWEIVPRESCKPMKGYEGPHGKFDGRTTFQTDFTGSRSNRPDLCIPKEAGIQFAGPQEFSTVYRDTFQGERPLSCPAKDLRERRELPSRHGYVYEEDRNGHQFYKPALAQTVGPLQKSVEVLAI